MNPAPGTVGRPRVKPFNYLISNLQGIGTCERQEDSFGFVNALDNEAIKSRGLMAVLADGMGGMTGGKYASETAVSIMRSDFAGYDMSGNVARQLTESAMRADDTVYGQLGGQGGCTLITCIFYKNSLYYMGVGDSYLFLMRGGSLYRINAAHNVLHRKFSEAISYSDISLRNITMERENRAVTKFIGSGRLSEPDLFVRPLPLYVGDVIMLCSDGVPDVLSEERIINALERPDVDEMCRVMDAEISDNPTGQYRDNYTALVIKCVYGKEYTL